MSNSITQPFLTLLMECGFFGIEQDWILDGIPRTRAQAVQLDKFLKEELNDELNLVVSLHVPDDVILHRISGTWSSDSSSTHQPTKRCLSHSIFIFFSLGFHTSQNNKVAGFTVHLVESTMCVTWLFPTTFKTWSHHATLGVLISLSLLPKLSQQTTYNPPKVEGQDDLTGEALIKRKDDTVEVFGNRLSLFHDENEPMLDYYDHHLISDTEPRKIKKLVNLFGQSSDAIWPQIVSHVQERVSFFFFFLLGWGPGLEKVYLSLCELDWSCLEWLSFLISRMLQRQIEQLTNPQSLRTVSCIAVLLTCTFTWFLFLFHVLFYLCVRWMVRSWFIPIPWSVCPTSLPLCLGVVTTLPFLCLDAFVLLTASYTRGKK